MRLTNQIYKRSCTSKEIPLTALKEYAAAIFNHTETLPSIFCGLKTTRLKTSEHFFLLLCSLIIYSNTKKPLPALPQAYSFGFEHESYLSP